MGYLTQNLQLDPSEAKIILAKDYSGTIKRDLPNYLKDFSEVKKKNPAMSSVENSIITSPKRQMRQLQSKDFGPS